MSAARVLVADDDAALLRICVRALRDAGIEADAASSGDIALEMAAPGAYAVVVSDIGMPDTSGLDLLRLLRSRDAEQTVILMTGEPEIASAIGAVEHGAMKYLVKPFAIGDLVNAVRQGLRIHELNRLRREIVAEVGQESGARELRARTAEALDSALAGLWMAYQPIYSWREAKPVAFEALVRTRESFFAHPGVLLAAAEDLGRLHELGRRIRGLVAGKISECPADLVFVNLHTRDLLDDELYSLAAPLTAWAKHVVLEITERVALEEICDAKARIAALRRMGYRIAIDDLGAGYSGLTSFAELAPDVVKFDMALARALEESPTRQRLLTSMTALFRELGVEVIAEGVETVAERDALLATGCDWLQGYLFGRPAAGFGVAAAVPAYA